MLQHWVRDREGFKLSLSEAIKRQCTYTAKVYDLNDRGPLAPGYLADVNIIELDKIGMSTPWVAHNLPDGGRRLCSRLLATEPPSNQAFRLSTMAPTSDKHPEY